MCARMGSERETTTSNGFLAMQRLGLPHDPVNPSRVEPAERGSEGRGRASRAASSLRSAPRARCARERRQNGEASGSAPGSAGSARAVTSARARRARRAHFPATNDSAWAVGGKNGLTHRMRGAGCAVQRSPSLPATLAPRSNRHHSAGAGLLADARLAAGPEIRRQFALEPAATANAAEKRQHLNQREGKIANNAEAVGLEDGQKVPRRLGDAHEQRARERPPRVLSISTYFRGSC